MRTVRLLTFVVLGTAAVPLLAQAINLRPGRYESVAEFEMPGGLKMPPQKDTQCITADDLKNFSKELTEQMGECKVAENKITANRMTFSATCTQQQETMTVSADVTFTGDAYNGVIKAKGKMGEMTIKTTAKRLGDCTQ